MKKIFTLLFISCLLSAGAQGYQRMLTDSLTTFKIALLLPGVRLEQPQSVNCINIQYQDCIVQTDSIYNGHTYKKVYLYNWGPLTGLIREDSVAKKVYFIPYCSNTEDLLYDFSMQQGDSINYTFPNLMQNPMTNGWYKVDSIRLRHDYGIFYRKHFFLSNRLNQNTSNGRRASLEMIEGVGSTIHPLFLYGDFAPWGDLLWTGHCVNTDFDEVVTCKWNNGTKVYFDSCAYTAAQNSSCVNHNDSCNYSNQCGAVQELSEVTSIRVYPNPATELVRVEIRSKNTGAFTISLANAIGLTIKKFPIKLSLGEESHEIMLSGLPAGFYFLHVDGSQNPAVKITLTSP